MEKLFNNKYVEFAKNIAVVWGVSVAIYLSVVGLNRTVEDFKTWMMFLGMTAVIVLLSYQIWQYGTMIKLMRGKKPTLRITSKEEETKKLN